MWYDLSPMRPDEHANTNARRWLETTALRQAGEAGQREAAIEGETQQKINAQAEALANMDMQA